MSYFSHSLPITSFLPSPSTRFLSTSPYLFLLLPSSPFHLLHLSIFLHSLSCLLFIPFLHLVPLSFLFFITIHPFLLFFIPSLLFLSSFCTLVCIIIPRVSCPAFLCLFCQHPRFLLTPPPPPPPPPPAVVLASSPSHLSPSSARLSVPQPRLSPRITSIFLPSCPCHEPHCLASCFLCVDL